MKTRSNMPLFVVECSDVKALSNSQIDLLRCGDYLVKKDASGSHAYKVSYKKDKVGICLTYCDGSGYIETVSYDYTGGKWVYNSTDVFEGTTVAQVKGLIETDKDIISKIVVEYDEGYTYFYFPDDILPLSISLNTHNILFKNGIAVDYQGNPIEGYNADEIYFTNEDHYIAFEGDLTEQVINGLSFIKYNGDIDSNIVLNSYYLFYPVTSGGTKLYLHKIRVPGPGGSPAYVHCYSTQSTPINSSSTSIPNLIPYWGDLTKVLVGITMESSLVLVCFNYSNLSNISRVTYDVSSIVSDEVTEL